MDKDLQQYYEEQFSMFCTKGWLDFTEDMQALYDAVYDITTVENLETLYFRKGQLDILNLVLERKKTFESTWEDLNGKENF
jgi:hypothetical protein